MRILKLRPAFAAIILLAPSIVTAALACDEHAAGHEPPKPRDRASIPASAFLYVGKSGPAAKPPASQAVQPPSLAQQQSAQSAPVR